MSNPFDLRNSAASASRAVRFVVRKSKASRRCAARGSRFATALRRAEAPPFLDIENGTRESKKSEADAVAENARFGCIEDEEFGARANGKGRRPAITLPQLRS